MIYLFLLVFAYVSVGIVFCFIYYYYDFGTVADNFSPIEIIFMWSLIGLCHVGSLFVIAANKINDFFHNLRRNKRL